MGQYWCGALSGADLQMLSAGPWGDKCSSGATSAGFSAVVAWPRPSARGTAEAHHWRGECWALKWHILPGRASCRVVLAEAASEERWSQLWSREGHLGGLCLVHSLGSHLAFVPSTTETWVAAPPARFSWQRPFPHWGTPRSRHLSPDQLAAADKT